MLRGLPFSNVLDLWCGHSCSSSPSSDTPRGSCSSGPTSFSCEPVWCMCAHEWSARCPSGCLYGKVPNDHDMMHRWSNLSCSLQGSQHHPRTCNTLIIYSLLFYKLSSSITSKLTKCFKDTPNPFIVFTPYITIRSFFIHF